MSAAPVTLSWDGTNDEGSIVTPGQYLIETHWEDGQGGSMDISKAILVLGGGNSGSGSILAEPNVLTHGQNTTVFVDHHSQPTTLKVKIYTLSGQLVTALQGSSLTSQASWNASGMASGIYIAIVDIYNSVGGHLGEQRLKLLVLH